MSISSMALRVGLSVSVMQGDDIEKALQELLGASAGPSGLVVTLRRHEEYELLLLPEFLVLFLKRFRRCFMLVFS